MKILVGCDPEVFVKDKTNGKFVCAEGLVRGTKAKPFKVPGGALQVDGTALEFNIQAARSQVEFAGNIARVFGELRKRVADRNPNLVIEVSPVADFDPKDFEGFSVEAKKLGCDPDYCAYSGKANEPPQGDRPFRTASGHVHIGWTKDMDPMDANHFETCRRITRLMDVYLFLPSLLWDKDKRRRELYGRPGTFRPKPYGVEYRVLSNAWLRDPELIKFVYSNVQQAIKDYSNQRVYYTPFLDDLELKIKCKDNAIKTGLIVNRIPYFLQGER